MGHAPEHYAHASRCDIARPLNSLPMGCPSPFSAAANGERLGNRDVAPVAALKHMCYGCHENIEHHKSTPEEVRH